MPQILQMQSNFAGGVVDPRLITRTDTERYYEAMQVGTNIISIPHGGFKRRGGLTHIDTLPNVYTRVTGQTITAPNGVGTGTTARINDGDAFTHMGTTNNMSTTDPYIIAHYDLGSAKTIVAADLLRTRFDFGTSVNGTDAFKIQYSTDNAVWNDYGNAITLVYGENKDVRRSSVITARYWRLIKTGATNFNTNTMIVNEFNVWEDSGTLSKSRAIEFEFSSTQEYVIVLHDRGAKIYRADTKILVAYLPLPYTEDEIFDIDYTQSADTLILVHEDHRPRSVVRGADHDLWTTEEISFSFIPQYNYNDASSPAGTDEIQDITFNTFSNGDTYRLELDGFLTNTITYSSTVSTNESRIRNALLDLRITPSSGITVSNTGGTTYRVTFSGDAQDDWSAIALFETNGSGTMTQADIQDGAQPVEDLWSITRGFPSAVTFHEQRLVFGGFKSLPNVLAFSVPGEFYNFDPFEGNDDDAIIVTIAADQINQVKDLYSGRTLQVFTTGGEFHCPNVENQPLTPATITVKRQTLHGSEGVGAFGVEGVTLFIDSGNVVREFVFDFVSDQYSANSISLLAPHLLNSIVDADTQLNPSDGFTTYFYVVNGDGTAAVLNILRQQNILAWSKWDTQGFFESVSISDNTPFFVVKRNINGVDYRFLEYVNNDTYTDSNAQVSQVASTSVSGLDHLDGEECRVRADGFVEASATPSGGAITLEFPRAEIEVGLNFDPLATTMPYAVDTQAGNTFFKHKRIVRGYLEVKDTLGIIVDGDLIPDQTFNDDLLDTPATPYSGRRELYTLGWDTRKELTITQVDPLPMTILAISAEVMVS